VVLEDLWVDLGDLWEVLEGQWVVLEDLWVDQVDLLEDLEARWEVEVTDLWEDLEDP